MVARKPVRNDVGDDDLFVFGILCQCFVFAAVFAAVFLLTEAYSLCYQEQRLPSRPHAPVVRGYASGDKSRRRGSSGGVSAGASGAGVDLGETLYNSNLMEPHLALELMEKIVRLTLTQQRDQEREREAHFKAEEDEESKREQEKKRTAAAGARPAPLWNGPLPLPWGEGDGGGGRGFVPERAALGR